LLSLLFLSSCSNGQAKQDAGYSNKFGSPIDAAPVMQPLQPGQPPQKPPKSISTQPAVMGGQPGTKLPFNQPFRLADEEFQFIAAKGKTYVGLESRPAMQATPGNTYFLLRYQVIHHGASAVTVPNNAAVHLYDATTQKVIDIDQAATNANVQSGAATGLPDQLTLTPEQPQIQTLVFQLPATVNAAELTVLVTDPRDPSRVFQMVNLSN